MNMEMWTDGKHAGQVGGAVAAATLMLAAALIIRHFSQVLVHRGT